MAIDIIWLGLAWLGLACEDNAIRFPFQNLYENIQKAAPVNQNP